MTVADNAPQDDLKTLGDDGSVPECRMENAATVRSFVRRLIQNDEPRSKKRAKVDGLVDGNAPYSPAKLRSANRSDAANVNTGEARGYLESGTSAFYDLFSEAPGYVLIETSYGNDQTKRLEWQRDMSLEADVLFSTEPELDNSIQISQLETVLHGHGPLYFEDEHKVFPMCLETADLLLPDRSRSTTERWEAAAILWDYYPPELYEFIENEKAADMAGWLVDFTKTVIQNAMDIKQQETERRNWEWYQRELKNNSLNYVSNGNKVCRVAHVFWKEFSGRITHAIVQRDDATGMGDEYLFLKVGRYANFREAIHPMYFDRGRGGYHHSVTGLGVKMYSLLEFQNRLFNNLLDKAFAPKMMFAPATPEAAQKFQIAKFGDWGMVPAGTQVLQTPIQGFITDGLAVMRTSGDMMRSNLSAYRQTVEAEKPGNPETKYKEQLKAAQQGALSNTTFSRYYKQMDMLYTEIVRRLANLNTTDERAKEWQRRCEARGVPRACFGRITTVKACRVVGAGSPFMRQNVLQALQPIVAGNEEGQANWKNDFIAAHAGQSAVLRYNPVKKEGDLPSDQHFDAAEGVCMAKLGVTPPVTSSQNATIFCGTYLKAATDAMNSLSKGGNPQEVLGFVHALGPAIQAHLMRLSKDPLRAEVFAVLEPQVKKLAANTDKLQGIVEQQAKQAQAQQAKAQGVMTDEQIKAQEAQGKLALAAQKQNATLAMKAQAHKQQLAIQDAKSASEIHRSNAMAAAEAANAANGAKEE